jgi:hypothetical protein
MKSSIFKVLLSVNSGAETCGHSTHIFCGLLSQNFQFFNSSLQDLLGSSLSIILSAHFSLIKTNCRELYHN